MIYRDPVHVSYTELTVTYDETPVLILNKQLLDQQLCWENLDEIKETHWLRLVLMNMMNETTDNDELKSLAQDITECEFQLQRLWKFEENINFHRFWDLPKCACPKLDNEDAYPSGHYVINHNCPVHSSTPERSGAV